MSDKIAEKYEMLKGAELVEENASTILSLLTSEQQRLSKARGIGLSEARMIAAQMIGDILKPPASGAEVASFAGIQMNKSRNKSRKPKIKRQRYHRKIQDKNKLILESNPIKRAKVLGQAEEDNKSEMLSLTDYLVQEVKTLQPGQIAEMVLDTEEIASRANHALVHAIAKLDWPLFDDNSLSYMSRQLGCLLFIGRLR